MSNTRMLFHVMLMHVDTKVCQVDSSSISHHHSFSKIIPQVIVWGCHKYPGVNCLFVLRNKRDLSRYKVNR